MPNKSQVIALEEHYLDSRGAAQFKGIERGAGARLGRRAGIPASVLERCTTWPHCG